MSDLITTDDILGKEVIDHNGKRIGVITKLHLKRSDKKLIGITIDPGFVSSDVFVGIDFVENFGKNVIMLNKTPQVAYIGLKIFREDGVYVGKIIGIDLKNNELNKIEFKYSKKLFKNKTEVIDKSFVKEIGYNIILKKSFKYLK